MEKNSRAHKRKKTESRQSEGCRKRKTADREKAISSKDCSHNYSSQNYGGPGSDEDDSDFDLDTELKPIDAFLKDTPEKIFNEMFKVLTKAKVFTNMLPDIVKNCSLEELKKCCVEQLEIMSRKRIKCILAGEPMSDSSDTEDELQDEEKGRQPQGYQDSSSTRNIANIADSTTQQEVRPKRQAEGWRGSQQSQGEDGEEEDVLNAREGQSGGDELVIHAADSPFSEDSDSCNTPGKRPRRAGPPRPGQEATTPCTAGGGGGGAQPSPGQPVSRRGGQLGGPAEGGRDRDPLAPGSSSEAGGGARQLELLELEMRARAIRSLLKAKEKQLVLSDSDPPPPPGQPTGDPL